MSEHFIKEITKDFKVIGVDLMTPNLLRKYIDDNGKSIFIIDISHTLISELNLSSIKAWCDSLVSLNNKELQGCMFKLSYNGYNFDPREIYEIPEAIRFTKKIVQLYPDLFYFLDEDSQKWILLSLNTPKVIETKVGVDGIDKAIEVNTGKLIGDIISIHKKMKRINEDDVISSRTKLLKAYGGI